MTRELSRKKDLEQPNRIQHVDNIQLLKIPILSISYQLIISILTFPAQNSTQYSTELAME